MVKSLQEYADWLDERDIIWPSPPQFVSAKASPYIKPLDGIRAVVWNVYGTLLRITDGRLLFDHPDRMRMQIALDKTIQEFNMWNSMNRKPMDPWEQMYNQYRRQLESYEMADTQKKGDFPEVDASRIWRQLLGQLGEKDYDYDLEFYGDPEELSDKVAYFFHANLQGIEAAPNALNALAAVSASDCVQGLLSDAQSFTLVQILRGLREQGTLPPLNKLFSLDCMILSFQEGLRKPSRSLYQSCLAQFAGHDIAPQELLYISSRLKDDLALAKAAGMRTALYAADKTSLRATKEEMKNPKMKPDRLLNDLTQIRDILGIG